MANVQIHELIDFSGSLGSGNYLATDDGTYTTKIPATAISDIAESNLTPTIAQMATLVITKSSFSSLPLTITDANIESDMVVVNAVLGSPASQTGDWTVTTSNGSLTVSGSISGSTTLTLYLMKSR